MGGLGPATNGNGGGSWPQTTGTALNAALGTDTITVSSNDWLGRVDNTEQAWNGSGFTNALMVNPNNYYFGGHFGAPGSSSSTPVFGDNLLGAFAPSGGDFGPPEITLTFSQALAYVSFQVSSASSANFTAQLLAFNSQGQMGTFQVTDTGGGGNCPGLALSTPQPCNDAALIQFFDPNDSITSVELVMLTDFSGVLIDSLEVAPTVPEPGGALPLAAAGFLALAYWKKRRCRRSS